jgi:phospholipid transport system substrate-binding protein
VLIAGSPGPATAGRATDELRGSIDQVVRILDDPALKAPARTGERRAAISRVMHDAIDYPDAAMRALGLHWRDRTGAEREAFVALFGDLVTYSYIVRIEPYAGEKVVYVGESVEGGAATVRTRIETRQGRDIPVDYRMHQRGPRWLIYDVVVEGVSLIANYRAQFNTIIQTSSYAELVRRIQARLAELTAPPR